MKMFVNKTLSKTAVEGFGYRYCIWMQGCEIKCDGCINKHMWKKEDGQEREVEDILQDIIRTEGIEGVTFLGGEPLDQARAVNELIAGIKSYELSVILFTGYLLENLYAEGNEDILSVLRQVDLLIDGPFIKDKRDYQRPWVGSSNQRFHFLTVRYKQEDLCKINSTQKFEIRIKTNGKIEVNGMGNLKTINRVINLEALNEEN